MQNKFILFIVGLLLTFVVACVSEPDYPLEPEIVYKSISKTTVNQGDSALITFSFTDGDGNIGNTDISNANCSSNNCIYLGDTTCFNDPFYSCFIIDTRDSCYSSIKLPNLEPSGNIKAISGELDVVVPPIFCKCNGCNVDTVQYQVIIKDASNNYSNVILSDYIYVNCN